MTYILFCELDPLIADHLGGGISVLDLSVELVFVLCRDSSPETLLSCGHCDCWYE